jgi:hypothetical protein
MAESFIPEGTNIICTNMTGGVPMQIMQQREIAYTIHDSKNKPLLNINDRKLSGPFSCVVPGMLWGGLEALCLGIAVAALAIAVVATGGLALVAIGVGLAACTVGIGAGITALCKIAHACDTTLSSKWGYPHDNVTIEGENAFALLNKSALFCNKGGVLYLIIDPVIAASAAIKISDHNMNQFYAQMGSQFLMGLIGTLGSVSGGGGSAGLIISSVIAVPAYFWGENDDDDSKKNEILGNAFENAAQDFVTEGGGEIVENAIEHPELLKNTGRLAQGAIIYGKGTVTGSVPDSLEGALRIAIAQNSLKGHFKEIFSWKNMKGGVISFVANLVIGVTSDIYENIQENKAINDSRNANKNDANNAISVVADNA